MIDKNEIEAYNFPRGTLFHMLREGAAKRPGVLTKVGLDTFIDPRRQGGRMNEHLGLASTPPSLRAPPDPPREWSYELLFDDLPVPDPVRA